MNLHHVAPSILAADFGNLQSEIEMLNLSSADLIHLDVMDGIFVPNISFGVPVVESISKHTKKDMDVHLMIEKPEHYIDIFNKLGAKYITVHFEACVHLHRTISQIKTCGSKAGIALNPHTNVENIFDVINEVDLVCIMSVNPGFGNQSFIKNTYQKISKLKEIIIKNNSKALIEIDGGVDLTNVLELVRAGADILVAGSSIFNSKDPIHTIELLKNPN